MWKTIKYVTINKNNASLKTVDIPVNGTVKWSDNKKDKSLKLVVDGISNHLNQAE